MLFVCLYAWVFVGVALVGWVWLDLVVCVCVCVCMCVYVCVCVYWRKPNTLNLNKSHTKMKNPKHSAYKNSCDCMPVSDSSVLLRGAPLLHIALSFCGVCMCVYMYVCICLFV
jgi:hypothetical protein